MNGSGKGILLMQALVILSPFLLYPLIQKDLRALFASSRPIHQARDLDQIHGAVAGSRVDAPRQRGAVLHEVVRGDTWSGIARKYGVADRAALELHNKGITLVEGARVEIPPELVTRP